MLDTLKKEANMTFTENGAVTYESTESDCLDFFATAGALRSRNDAEIIARFVRAYTEDPDIAMKILFFARDIRSGLGERRLFRVILKWLAEHEPGSVRKNLEYVAEFGRYDDLMSVMGTPCEDDAIELISMQLGLDLRALEKDENISLLAKWLPSVNASNKETVRNAKKIARALGYDDASYRRMLTALRARIRIIENNLRTRDYSFDYEKQPSLALYKYRQAFIRNDRDRYRDFLNSVERGGAVLHADNVAPYQLVERYLAGCGICCYGRRTQISEEEKQALNATWASLPDFGNEENTLAVIDTSGSMYCEREPVPAAVALSLGLYFAEHSTGMFRNHFIEFSRRPQLIEVKGDTFVEKLRYLTTFNEIADTNLEAVFDLILKTAVKNRLDAGALPAKLVIISDMEFNACVTHSSKTVFQNAKEQYASYGYKLPDIVFWNAAARHSQQPVTKNEQGVILISGVTPRLFEMVAGGEYSPYTFMMEVVNSARYAGIVA